MEPNLAIPQPVAQAILNYLAKQPYGEVVALVQALIQLKPIDTKDAAATDADGAR